MEYSFIAQDEEDIISNRSLRDGKKLKEPVTVEIKITIEKTKYLSILQKYKTHVSDKILAFFK